MSPETLSPAYPRSNARLSLSFHARVTRSISKIPCFRYHSRPGRISMHPSARYSSSSGIVSLKAFQASGSVTGSEITHPFSRMGRALPEETCNYVPAMRRNDHPSRPNAITRCLSSPLKTLLPTKVIWSCQCHESPAPKGGYPYRSSATWEQCRSRDGTQRRAYGDAPEITARFCDPAET